MSKRKTPLEQKQIDEKNAEKIKLKEQEIADNKKSKLIDIAVDVLKQINKSKICFSCCV